MTIYTWDEAKRRSNLRKHGLDFAEAPAVVESEDAQTVEDDRFHYNERRFLTLGRHFDQVVAIIHTENNYGIRIISFRKATHRETIRFWRKYGRLA